MNLMLGILEIIVCFFGIVILDKLFGKWGLFAWISLAVVFANIQVAKQVDILGFATSLGNVVFASTYLTTDILNEKYGESLFEEEGLISGIKKELEEFLKNRLADIFQEFYEELLGTDGL